MEGNSKQIESLDKILVKKHGLTAGRKVVFRKISIDSNSNSNVPVGNEMSGFLDSDVKIGYPIELDNGKGIISNVKFITERNGDLFITTNTSEYQLVYNINDIAGVETAKGSTYRYLDSGMTQRFKKVENKNYEPQSILVYVPDFNYIKNYLKPEELSKVGDNLGEYEQNLLEYIHGKNKKIYIVDKNGVKIENNQSAINEKGNIFMVFGDENKIDFSIPVSIIPKIGFHTYDSRKYKDEEIGEYMREVHLGNKVVKIIRKGEKF